MRKFSVQLNLSTPSRVSTKTSTFVTSRRTITVNSLKFNNFGAVDEVLSLQQETLNKNEQNSVVVKLLASSINPADFNFIQGFNGKQKPTFPAVPGMEGVGIIEESSDPSLSPGDWVVPSGTSFGTWRTYATCKSSDLIKISKDIPVSSAAVLSVNPTTAYCLLENFVPLKKGDVVIQNYANGTVGQSVIQLAKQKGVKTINVVQNSDAKLSQFLKGLGADEVVDEATLQSYKFKDTVLSKYGAPTLALNAAGGQSATDIARFLKEGSTFVTIGGLPNRHVTLPSGLLIFKDINCRGFWINRWIQQHSVDERRKILESLISMVKQGTLKFNITEIPFNEYTRAIKESKASPASNVVLKF